MYSCNDVKKNLPIKTRAPEAGTRVRAFYDFLVERKYQPLSTADINVALGLSTAEWRNLIHYLKDFYDMEIIHPRYGVTVFVGFFDHNGKLV